MSKYKSKKIDLMVFRIISIEYHMIKDEYDYMKRSIYKSAKEILPNDFARLIREGISK